jgi:hypothetical protein
MIVLINGPYNGREIEDSGAVVIRMAVYDGGNRVGAKTGEAIYEPSEDGRRAFYSDTKWLGIIEEIVPAQ